MSKCIKCGSYAFNLYKEGIDQGGLCDVHYWQGRAHRAEALAEQPAQQEPVALFKWLPEGATHIGRISVRTTAGGSLAMTTHAFKYEEAVLKVYITDNDNEYPGWRDAKDCFFHLNFPVLPLYTSPPAQQEPVACKTLCELCAKRGYSGCANAAQITPIPSPPAQQEPVAWIFKPHRELLWPNEVERKNPLELNEYAPLYTTPPAALRQSAQRPWLGLTDEEIKKLAAPLFMTHYWKLCNEFARAIEAKLKEKNNG